MNSISISKSITSIIILYYSSQSSHALSTPTTKIINNRKVTIMSSPKRRNAMTTTNLAKIILQKRKKYDASEEFKDNNDDFMSWIECLFDDECVLYNQDHFNIGGGVLNKPTKNRKLGLFGSPELYRDDVNSILDIDDSIDVFDNESGVKPPIAKNIPKDNKKVIKTKTIDDKEPIKQIKNESSTKTKNNNRIIKAKDQSSTHKGQTKISKFKASRSKIAIRNKTELSLMKCLFGDGKTNKASSTKSKSILIETTTTDIKNVNVEEMLQKQAIVNRKKQKVNDETSINKKSFTEKVTSNTKGNQKDKVVRLTKEDEIELANLIQQGIKLQAIKSQYENEHDQRITHEEWATISDLNSIQLEEQLNASLDAKNKLITSNLGLVYSTIKNGNYGRISEEELVQEGCLGLIRAAELFDPSKGYRFSTYATIWIKGTLGNCRIDQTISIPEREKRKWNKIQKAVQELTPHSTDFIKRIDNVQVIAEMVDMSAEDVQRITRQMNNMKRILSLDYKYTSTSNSGATITSESDFSLEHRQKTSESSPDDPVNLQQINHLRHDVLAALSNTLSSREEQILRLRYGLTDDEKCRSIVECAREMGLSRARVQQLAASSLKKLREKEDVIMLQEYLAQI